MGGRKDLGACQEAWGAIGCATPCATSRECAWVDNCVYVLFASEADSNLARASEWFHEKMRDYAGDDTTLGCQHGDDVMIRRPRTGWDGSEAQTASDTGALSKTMIEEIGAFMKDKIGATELDQQAVDVLLARMQQPHNSE